jgi:superfamily II DNA helicase RecQ
LWHPDDVATREFLINSPRQQTSAARRMVIDPDEIARRKAIEHAKLRRMISYATTYECLRKTILQYFGDIIRQQRCGACGNCTTR